MVQYAIYYQLKRQAPVILERVSLELTPIGLLKFHIMVWVRTRDCKDTNIIFSYNILFLNIKDISRAEDVIVLKMFDGITFG